MKTLLKYYPYIIAFLTLICFLLLFVESVPYLRFIIVSLRINTLALQLVLLIAWLPLFFGQDFFNSKLMIVVLLLAIVGESATKTTLNIYRELRNIASGPFLSYDQKMTNVYKGFYPAMKEVVRLTPEDSAIIIPPRANPWEFEGNVAMVTYFVYPRRVVNMALNAKQVPAINGKRYVLIARGGSERKGLIDYGWPKISVKTSNLWQINTDNGSTTSLTKDYDPAEDKWAWGLIEVKND